MKTVEAAFKPRNKINGRLAEKTKKTMRYMQLAAGMAEQSEYGKIRHGAILVKGGSIISAAYNKSNYNSFGNRFRKHGCGHATHHAELGCILGLERSKTAGSTVYVARINKEGEYRLSKPCSMCHDALKHVGVKKVYYTAGDNSIEMYKI